MHTYTAEPNITDCCVQVSTHFANAGLLVQARLKANICNMLCCTASSTQTTCTERCMQATSMAVLRERLACMGIMPNQVNSKLAQLRMRTSHSSTKQREKKTMTISLSLNCTVTKKLCLFRLPADENSLERSNSDTSSGCVKLVPTARPSPVSAVHVQVCCEAESALSIQLTPSCSLRIFQQRTACSACHKACKRHVSWCLIC